jgi:glycosyltransferase involved in cell wall biosynthesis
VTTSDVDVSVIVAVHNGAATLHQCIESVLAQTGCRVELIIVDALSDDGTQAIINSYGDAIASYVREADRGIYDAWNKALSVTRGEWCAFLGSDDYYYDNAAIKTLLACAREATESPVFVFGGVIRIDGMNDYVIHPNPPNLLKHLRKGRMLPHQGFLHDVGALHSIGGFDASFRIAGDFDAVFRLLEKGPARRCEAVVTAMRVGGVGSARSHRQRRHREHRQVLSRERGSAQALLLYLTKRLHQMLVGSVERALLTALGRDLGRSIARRLRTRLRRTPELL